MIHNLAQVNDDIDRFEGQEVTVRCKVIGDAHRGATGGEKILYEVDDPSGNLEMQAFLSFWLEDPHGGGFGDLRQTEQYVRESLADSGETPDLPRGEKLLVRGIPRVTEWQDTPRLYINVTSVVIRAPELYIGKSELRTARSCPRRYYLRYVKNVYEGESSLNPHFFKGDGVHLALETAIENHRGRFVQNSWTDDQAFEFANDVMDDEMAMYQAKLAISGIGLDAKEFVEEIVTRLFTDDNFCEHIPADGTLETERPLSERYGYNGQVDLLVDGTPYDLKTTYQLDTDTQVKHERQLHLYLFALLLEELEPGEDLLTHLDDERVGYLVYPNLEETDTVKIEQVSLDIDTVATLIDERNEVAAVRGGFGPPSTYNRECEGCNYRTEQQVGGEDETLPPACTYHCQNERRWPCYEFDDERGVTSDCSLFEECEQRLRYRDTDQIDHYNALRSALQSERNARQTANELMESIDADLLQKSGRLVTGLEVSGGNNLGLVYETDDEIIPAFSPGDIVRLEPAIDGKQGKAVPYLGRDGEGYAFGFSEIDSEFMNPETEYKVWYGFDADIVSRRYLPYLDYAQRQNTNRKFEYDETGDTAGAVTVDESETIPQYLDGEELFIDLPARTDRSDVLAQLIATLTSAPYPHPTDDAVVPEVGRRALVLCQNPSQVAHAHEATTGENHYRMDGFSNGPSAIHGNIDREEIQNRLLSSRSIISTVQYALSSDNFHEFSEGHFGDRDHSEQFFDVVVLVGAEHITEPVYLYLSDVADRVVSIGDRRRTGLDMVSSDAQDRGLDRSYFEWAHNRYATAPVADATSIQFPGHGNQFIQELFDETIFEPNDGSLSFFGFEGAETSTSDDLLLRAAIRARNGLGKDLTFDVTDTSANPFEVQDVFIDREYLDATNLPESGTILLDEHAMYLDEKNALEEVENPTFHRVSIRADPNAIPAFSEAFLHNSAEAKIIAELAEEYEPGLVVTPFEAQANELAGELAETDIDVALPETLEDIRTDKAIVSFTAANEAGILHPPLTEPSTLYELLTAAQDLLLVGNEQTLRSKDATEYLVTELADRYEYTGDD